MPTTMPKHLAVLCPNAMKRSEPLEAPSSLEDQVRGNLTEKLEVILLMEHLGPALLNQGTPLPVSQKAGNRLLEHLWVCRGRVDWVWAGLLWRSENGSAFALLHWS
jgi:hypothetical protein